MLLLMCLAFTATAFHGQNEKDMVRLTTEIDISNYKVSGVVDCEIESSWDMFTDRCTVTLPKRVEVAGRPSAFGTDPIFRRGDAVTVRAGYDDDNQELFTGYVQQIHTNVPVTIDCQDAMWLLKQSTITKSYKSVTLDRLLKDILPESVPFESPSLGLGTFRISKATPVQVLEELKKTYFLKSWMRGGKLYCGFAYVPKLRNDVSILFERDVPEQSLEFMRQEDVRIKLKVISMQPDNSKIEYETGDPDGEQRTLHVYNQSLDDVKKYADEQIQRLRYEGYRGSFTTFLQPRIQHGDVVNLESRQYPERNGGYLVKKVTTTFGTEGGRQIVELDTKVV